MGRKKIYDDSNNELIRELYTEKQMSLSIIAQMLGMHPQVVKRKLQSMGVETRNISKAMKVHHEKRRTNE